MHVLTTLAIVIIKLLNYLFPSFFFSLCSYQNSFKHSICIEMLRQGYHKSFSELFALIQKWNALRDAGGPGSAIWQQKPLEEQHEKLDQLQHFLTRAEAAQRAGKKREFWENGAAGAEATKASGEDSKIVSSLSLKHYYSLAHISFTLISRIAR